MRILSLAILLASAPAVADTGTGVVVIGESTLQPQLVAQLETWLTDHGHPLISAALAPDAISTLIDCFAIEDETCARAVFERRAKSDNLVFARIEASPGTDGMRDVTLTAYWLEKGREAIADRRYCEHCTDHTLHTTANELIAALAKSGHHEVATAPSREPEAPAPLLEDQPRSSRLVPAALAIGGASMLVAGGIMIAIDQDESPSGPLYIRDTAPAGVVLATAGAIAAGIGVYLWLRSDTSGPTVTASRDGGSIGWFTRF